MKRTRKIRQRFLLVKWLFFLVLPFAIPAYGQNLTTEWVRPLPQGNTLSDVIFLDNHTGLFIGHGGTIMRTENMGATWEFIASPTTENLHSLYFLDTQKGFAVGDEGVGIKTTDGGKTWARFNTGVSYPLYKVVFLDTKKGFAAGANGTLLKTADGGNYWEKINTGSKGYTHFMDIAFANERKGVAVGNRGTMYITEDGGITWEASNPVPANPVQDNLNGVFFATSLKGYIASEDMSFFMTEDGGNTWFRKQLATRGSNDVTRILFKTAQKGIALGKSGLIYTTNDGGETWSKAKRDREAIDYSSAFFIDERNIFAVGDAGQVVRTMDGGQTWANVAQNAERGGFSAIAFPSTQTGYLLRNDGFVFKSSNGGQQWQELPNKVNPRVFTNAFRGMEFVSDTKGFAYMSTGSYLFKTEDGGQNWTQISGQVEAKATGLQFVDANTGYVITSGDQILKTTDGGETWTALTLPGRKMSDLSFLDETTGYVATNDGQVYATKDGGNSWHTLSIGNTEDISAICFLDQQRGFATTRDYRKGAFMYQTKDGGNTWEKSELSKNYIMGIKFSRGAKMGLAYGLGGDLFVSWDKGTTWHQQPSGTSNSIYDVHFVGNYAAYLAADNGSLLYLQPNGNAGVKADEYTEEEENTNQGLKSTVVLNGVKMNISDDKDTGKGYRRATLLEDTQITVGGNKLTLKGGEFLFYHPEGYVTIATLNGISNFLKLDDSFVKLRPNTQIELYPDKVKRAKLWESTMVSSGEGDMPCMYTTGQYDVAFDEAGRLAEAVFSRAMTFNFDEVALEIPHKSRVFLENGKIKSIQLGKPILVNIGGKEITLAQMIGEGDRYSVEIEASKRSIQKVTVGSNVHAIVKGTRMSLAPKSQILFNRSSLGDYLTYLVDENGKLTSIQLDGVLDPSLEAEEATFERIQKESLQEKIETQQQVREPTVVKLEKDGNETEVAANAEAPDSTLSTIALNGSEVTIKDDNGGKGLLKDDTKFAVGSQVFVLKGGNPITYHAEKKYVTSGTLAEATDVTNNAGSFTAMAGSKINFSQAMVSAVVLDRDVIFRSASGEIPCKAGGNSNSYDVTFDGSGEVSSATLSQDATYTLDGRQFTFPANSRIILARGHISNVALSSSIPLDIAGTTYTVSAAPGETSIDFQPGNGFIREFRVAAGHEAAVDGYQIPLKADSRVVLEKTGNGYAFSKIYLGRDMMLRIEKNSGKVKEKEVKEGRKLVIENGKIVKASIF